MNMFKRLNRLNEVLGGHFPGWLVVIVMSLVMVQVLTRYVLRHPLSAGDEISGLITVVISFLGLGYTWQNKRHIRLDFAVNMLPKKIAAWVRLIVLFLVLVFVGLLSVVCLQLSMNSWRLGARSYDVAVPLTYPQFGMFIGSALFFIWVLVDIVQYIRVLTGKSTTKEAVESLESGTGEPVL